MAERDRARLADARRRVDVSPLGAGALAGAGYPLDREATARGPRVRRRAGELARRRQRSRLRRRDAGAPSRSGWSTSAGSPRSSRGGRTRGSGSSRRATRSRRAARSCRTRRTRIRPSWSAAAPAGVIGDADRRCWRCSRACRSPTSATSRRTRRRCSESVAVFEASLGVLAGMLGDADRGPRPDAGRRRRGLHDGDGRRRRAGPARHPVPRRPPRRRVARRPGRGRGASGWTRCPTR